MTKRDIAGCVAVWFFFILPVAALYLFIPFGESVIAQQAFFVSQRHRIQQESAYCEGQLKACIMFNPFQQAMQKIGSIPYDANFANCYDHSKLLAKELEKSGIKSSIFVNKDRSHAWIAVWIEANTGRFMLPENAQQLLEVRDGSNPESVQCYN